MNPDVTEYLTSLQGSAKFGPQVVCHRSFPPIDAKYASGFPPLHPALQECLKESGMTKLYSHQHRAISSVLAGKDILVATPTASGKSMVYNLPVLNDLWHDAPGHALYIFPLKALAQDQHKVLEAMFLELPPPIRQKYKQLSALFDGDTSTYRRRKIREAP